MASTWDMMFSSRVLLPPLPHLRGRVGVGALSAMGFAERAPTRLASLGTLPRKREREELHRRRGDAAIDHDGLPGHEARCIGAQIGYRAGDFVGLADPPQRRGGAAAL